MVLKNNLFFTQQTRKNTPSSISSTIFAIIEPLRAKVFTKGKNVVNKLSKLSILILTMILIGCSPRYQINTLYEPPASNQGLLCVMKKCNEQRDTCQNICDTQYNQCYTAKKQEATIYYDKFHTQQQQEYELEYQEYRRKLQHADRERRQLYIDRDYAESHCMKNEKSYYCDDYQAINTAIKQLQDPYKPSYPPTLEDTIEDFQNTCSHDCSHCDTTFEQCYVGCGGKVIKERVCIANCE